MISRKYGGLKKAVLSELREERMERWEHYLAWFLMLWILIMGLAFLYTQNYCEMLMLKSMMTEQNMNSTLWFRVMTW